jgi:hypothetical protein
MMCAKWAPQKDIKNVRSAGLGMLPKFFLLAEFFSVSVYAGCCI